MEALHFDAVEAIYATAEGARDWSDALSMLCANVGAEGAWLGLHRARGEAVGFASVVGDTAVVTALPQSFVGRAGEQDRAYVAPDLLCPLGGFGIRRPWIEADDVTDDAHLIRLDLLRADGSTLVLQCARSAASGPFRDDAQSVLEQLVQHVDRALRLSARLPDPTDERLRELDLRGVPALVLDRSRAVVAMNHAAREFSDAMALPWQVGTPLELGACHRNAELTRVLRLSGGGALAPDPVSLAALQARQLYRRANVIQTVSLSFSGRSQKGSVDWTDAGHRVLSQITARGIAEQVLTLSLPADKAGAYVAPQMMQRQMRLLAQTFLAEEESNGFSALATEYEGNRPLPHTALRTPQTMKAAFKGRFSALVPT